MSATPAASSPKFPIALAAMLLTQSFASSVLNGASVVAPIVGPATGFDAQWISVYVFVNTAVGMVFGLVASPVVARFGPLRSIQVACVTLALGITLVAGGTGVAYFLSAVLVGIGYGPIGPGSALIIARAAPPDRMALAMSVKQVGAPAGIALVGAVLPILMLELGWRTAILLYASMGVLIALLLEPLRARMDLGRDVQVRIDLRGTLAPLRVTLGDPQLRRVTLFSLSLALAQTAHIVFIVGYLHFDHGVSIVAAGLALTASQIASIAGRICWGWVSDRIGHPFRVLGWIAASSIACLLLLGLWPPGPATGALIAIGAIAGAMCSGWFGVVMAATVKYSDRDRFVRASAGILFINFVGGLLGTVIAGGAIALTGSYSDGFVAIAIAESILTLLAYRPGSAGRAEKRR